MAATPTSMSMDTHWKKRFILEFRSAKANNCSDNLVCRTFDGYMGTMEWLIIRGDFMFMIYDDLEYFITVRIIIELYVQMNVYAYAKISTMRPFLTHDLFPCWVKIVFCFPFSVVVQFYLLIVSILRLYSQSFLIYCCRCSNKRLRRTN